jgi:hypothetical protein
MSVISRLIMPQRDEFVLRRTSENNHCNSTHFRRKQWILRRTFDITYKSLELSSIATRLWTGRPGNQGSIPVTDNNFFSSQHPHRLWGPPSLYLMVLEFLPGKWSDRSVKLTTQLHRILRTPMITATSHSPTSIKVWCSTEDSGNFTFSSHS